MKTAQGVKTRVLFVDDEPNILEGLQDLLMRYRRKWDMVFVGSGEAALHEIARRHVDVVVSDMRMPGLDGAELLQRVQESRPHVVRIMLSGYSDLNAALRAVPVAHQFLTKPTSAEVIENMIERACSLQALIQDDRIRGIIGRLQNLPSLPKVYARLVKLLSNEHSGAREVTQLIEQDPAMCAKILQLVNSSFFGQSHQIASIHGAVAYLGFNMIKTLTLSVGVFQPIAKTRFGAFSLETLQKHSVFVSALAMRMFDGKKHQAEDAFMAGMLHDLGKLVLGIGLPDESAFVDEMRQPPIRPPHAIEQEHFGVTHAEIGAYILGLWGLPYSVVEAVAHHHCPDRVPQKEFDTLASVHVANALSHEIAVEAGRADERNCAVSSDYLAALGVSGELEGWRHTARALWFEASLEG
jgi:putative nucleotidyltransferase with HDIG domain